VCLVWGELVESIPKLLPELVVVGALLDDVPRRNDELAPALFEHVQVLAGKIPMYTVYVV
jgi:hypothetical protein